MTKINKPLTPYPATLIDGSTCNLPLPFSGGERLTKEMAIILSMALIHRSLSNAKANIAARKAKGVTVTAEEHKAMLLSRLTGLT